MNRDLDDSFLQSSPDRFRGNLSSIVCSITPELISEVSGNNVSNISRLQVLDLHLRDEKKGKIRRIENMILVPNLRQLNLSYNAIIKIENLGRLHNLIELNLAENAIEKIENLDNLKALERLNLSGNQITRIPDSISNLQRLTNLRIARNQLHVLADLRCLGKLMNLTKLRIDENPFSRLEHTALFAIYCIKGLISLDGVAVTQRDREDARHQFSTSDISDLRSRLAEELHNLAQLKREVGKSPERRLAQRSVELSRLGGRGNVQFKEAQRELDEAHLSLAQKLQLIAASEKQIERLQRHIEAMADVSEEREYAAESPPYRRAAQPGWENFSGGVDRETAPVPPRRNEPVRRDEETMREQLTPIQPQRYSSPVPFYAPPSPTAGREFTDYSGQSGAADRGRFRDDAGSPPRTAAPLPTAAVIRSSEAPSTPAANRTPAGTPGGRAALTPGSGRLSTPVAELAAQQIAQLTDRVENLATKLLASDKEKTALKEQLETSRRTTAATATANTNESSTGAIPSRESDLIRLNQVLQGQLKDTQESLAKAVEETGAVKEKLQHSNEQLEVSQAEVRKNAVQKESLKRELEIINAENEKIRKEMLDLRKAIVENDSLTTERTLNRLSGGTAVDQWRAHESRVEIAGQRAELDALRLEVSKLHRELEKSMRETTAANEARLTAVQDAEQLRGKLLVCEETGRGTKNRIAELEGDLRRITNRLNEAESSKNAFEEECARLTTSLAIQEAEMDAYIKAREATPIKVSSSRGVTVQGRAASSSAGGLFQSPIRGRAHRVEVAAAGGNTATGDFFDIVSDSGSEDSGPVRPGQFESSAPLEHRPHHPSATSATTNRPFYHTHPQAPAKFSVSQLEVAAAEVMALVLMQEIEANTPPAPLSSSTSAGSSGNTVAKNVYLKDACIRAALRVIHSSTSMVRQQQVERLRRESSSGLEMENPGIPEEHVGGERDIFGDTLPRDGDMDGGVDESKLSDSRIGLPSPSKHRAGSPSKQPRTAKGRVAEASKQLGRIEIHPFHALGNRDFLSRVVAETHAGMAAIEDSDLLRQEVKQLENLVHDLETKSLTLESSIANKQHALDTLNKHCDDAKSQAEDALNELDFLTKRLQEGRDNITKTETEHNLQKRELELTRHGLQEALAMGELEHHNLHTVRSRLVELKHEVSETEKHILLCKESCLKEEDRLRTTKAMATDQLRLLQMDLNKIQGDFKVKQRMIEDLEKHRRSVDEEIEIKRRDIDLHLHATSRELEEESRKLNNVKCEVRVHRLEVEQLVAKRRQLDGEIQRLSETFSAETSKCDAEEQEAKRRLLQYEKQLQVAEKQMREAKSKLAAFEGEEVILRHSVEELRRTQGEMERAAELRRRTTEEELAIAQHQAQVAVRTSKQAEGQMETRRAELEGLALELRSTERRLDELKRQVREQEMLLDSHRDTVKVLDMDKDRRHKDTALVRKEEEELRHQTQVLRAHIDNDNRANEELRRRLVALKEEESSLKESEMRLRTAVLQSRKAVEDSQNELNEVRAAAERERRNLADIRTKKNVAEAEMASLAEALKFEAERVAQESLGRAELESKMLRTQEETNRSQKALAAIEKRIEDAVRKEDDLKRSETALKANIEKLRLETEGLNCLQSNEKSSVHTAREELRDINIEIRRCKEGLRVVQQELQTGHLSLETLQAQKDHLEDLKDELTAELNRLRETSRLEMKRTEKLESTYADSENRLKALRADLTSTEQSYERMRNLSAEEEQRVQGQRRALRSTLDELNKVEKAVSEAHQQMYDERQRALVEIGQLGQAKQSAHAHMFLTNEAQRRLESRVPLPSAARSISPLRSRVPDGGVNNFTSSLNVPDYLLSQATSTLYKTTPTTATIGIKLDSAGTATATPSSAGEKHNNFLRETRNDILASLQLRSSREGAPILSDFPSAAHPVIQRPAPPTSLAHTDSGMGGVRASQPAVELNSLQREVEKLKLQSAAVLSSANVGNR